MNSSFLLKDDLEIVDANKLVKIDQYSRGLFQNMFRFWDIEIEQQNNEIRCFHFIPKPTVFMQICAAQKTAINSNNNNPQ